MCVRLLLRKEHIDTHTNIKLSEGKVLVSRKRNAIEADLDADVLQEPIPETMNDVRIRVGISVFDFGAEVDAGSDERDADMDDE